MMTRRQNTEDRGQTRCRGAAAALLLSHREAVHKSQSSVFCRLSSEHGFTLIELIIVICIVAVMSGIFLKRVVFYQEMAEKAAVQQVVGALQSALILQYGHRMASGLSGAEKSVVYENPMDWLMQKPGNYAGEFNQVNPAKMEPGTWAFDKSAKELIYYPDHTEHFKPSNNEVKWIRYKTRLLYEPNYRNKKVLELAGMIISPIEPFQWLIKEEE